MSNRRTPPFPGFSRGIPLIGQPEQKPPRGRYFYQVPALIVRPGEPMGADTYEAQLSMPLNGVHFKQLAEELKKQLTEAEPDKPEPKVILLQPIHLGFIPEDRLPANDRKNGDAPPMGGTV